MFHKLRAIHKWIGLFACLFLVIISATGFFLAIKGSVGWMRPPSEKGGEIASFADVVPVDVAAQSAFGAGIAELKSYDDIDRFEYHADKNIYKIHSAKGYHEVQVDGASGEVLSTGKRADQFMEDIHDLSIFADFAHAWILPVVAICLFLLGLTGVIMYFVPVARRWKYRKTQQTQKSA
ncbi:MAG: PepSY domain-containing protein [Armatimonadetes bacterium]|nr:PepSY domain-containing protein [Armatimonadota bacterium]